MRKLIVLILVLSGLWGGYWFIGSTAVERGLTMWLDSRQNDGWVVEYDTVRTAGFPNRFDTEITGINLADTNTGVAWQAPFFQILTLSYRPNHIIALWPAEQMLATPYEKITITNDLMRGSVVFRPGTSLTLDRSDFELVDFALRSTLGWSSRIGHGQFSTRQTDAGDNSHRIWFEAKQVYPSAAVLDRLDPAGVLSDVFDTLTIDATLAFDAPWDRFAIEQARPQVAGIDLKDLRAQWGDLEFRAAGKLEIDTAGYLAGQITIKATNWREMLKIAVDTGVVPEPMVLTFTRALEVLAGMSGDPDTLDAPLTFRKGRISLALIPLGPAPRLVIR